MKDWLQLKNLVTIFTSLCTILSLFYIIAPNATSVNLVVYYFIFALVLFLILVFFRFSRTLNRLDKGQKDGRTFWIVLSEVFTLAAISLYFYDWEKANEWGLGLIAIGLVLFLLAIGLVFYFWLNGFIHNCEKIDFLVRSADVSITRDHHHYEYDVLKNIECRRTIMTSLDCGIKWSGDPVVDRDCISSSLQEVGKLHPNKEDFDKVELILKNPLYYKQDAALHMHMHLTDFKKTASQYLSYVVKDGHKINYIKFKVVLFDASRTSGCSAHLDKRALSSSSNTYVSMDTKVDFHKETRSYEYVLWNPQPGFDYRLSWDN